MNKSNGFEREAVLVGGSGDGYSWTMIRHNPPKAGCRTMRNGERYMLDSVEQDIVIFKPIAEVKGNQ